MTFEELGALLRTERERRGIDIATVAEKLRINARIIRSLESGDPSGMPHAVYVRGFIRSYASFLDMDASELSSTINSLYPEEDSTAYSSPLVEEEHDPSDGSGKIFVLLAILVCCAGAGIFWMHYGDDLAAELGHNMPGVTGAGKTPSAAKPAPQKNRADRNAESKNREALVDNRTPTPPISVKQLENQKSAGRAEQAAQTPRAEQPQQAQRPEQQQPGRSERAAQGAAPTADEPGGREQAAPLSSAATAASSSAPAAERGGQPVGKHQLILTAQAECWVHSNADNADTRQFSLRKGDTFVLTFSNKLVLKLGSAGGVRLRYDGRELPPVGNVGQVRTLTFPPAE